MGVRSEIEANFDYEIVDEFLDHYGMMVDNMEIMIIDLSKPNMFEQSINELFRVFHNIKSATGYLRIEPMAKLSGFVEDALQQIRSDYTTVNDETINWLLSISDMYALWNEDLKHNNDLTHIKYSLLKLPDLDKK